MIGKQEDQVIGGPLGVKEVRSGQLKPSPRFALNLSGLGAVNKPAEGRLERALPTYCLEHASRLCIFSGLIPIYASILLCSPHLLLKLLSSKPPLPSPPSLLPSSPQGRPNSLCCTLKPEIASATRERFAWALTPSNFLPATKKRSRWGP